jgi:hypothetical protein
MSIYDHPDFIGFRDDGACIWRRRADKPEKKISVQAPTSKAGQIGRIDGLQSCTSGYSSEERDIKSIRTCWVVNKSNASRSIASLVADLFFEAIND